MRPTNRFLAIAFFLVMVLSMVTPATVNAQFGNQSEQYIVPLVETERFGNEDVSLLTVSAFTPACMELYQTFWNLSKLSATGVAEQGQPARWESIPIAFLPLEGAKLVKKGPFNQLGLPNGVYVLSLRPSSNYGNAGKNVDMSKFCSSNIQSIIHRENIIFAVGQRLEVPESLSGQVPLITMADPMAAKQNRLEFGARLPHASRLVMYQVDANGYVSYTAQDVDATGGEFRRLAFNLPFVFDPRLPVTVYVKDRTTTYSTSTKVLTPSPVTTVLGDNPQKKW